MGKDSGEAGVLETVGRLSEKLETIREFRLNIEAEPQNFEYDFLQVLCILWSTSMGLDSSRLEASHSHRETLHISKGRGALS